MNLLLLAVGRSRTGGRPTPDAALVADYAKRLPGGWTLSVREVEARGPRLSPADRVGREGSLLLEAVPAGAHVVVLDETGRALSSEAFAGHLGRLRDDGVRCVAFLIGGADGHGPAVRTRANLVLSLGPMTWPHRLVRPMLAEQLYRAQTILAGHPYHRGG